MFCFVAEGRLMALTGYNAMFHAVTAFLLYHKAKFNGALGLHYIQVRRCTHMCVALDSDACCCLACSLIFSLFFLCALCFPQTFLLFTSTITCTFCLSSG